MKGELAPFVLAARFTSFLGPGIHTTAPMDVSGFDRAVFEFWRGHLAGSSSSFKAYFEQADTPGPDPAAWNSDPANPWSNLVTPITPVNTTELVAFTITKRFLRMRIGLDGIEAGITLFAVGSIRRRVANIG